MLSLLLYNLIKYTHPLIQTNKISHRGADSEIVSRALEKMVMNGRAFSVFFSEYIADCILIIYTDTHVSNYTFEKRSPLKGPNKLLPSFFELLILKYII